MADELGGFKIANAKVEGRTLGESLIPVVDTIFEFFECVGQGGREVLPEFVVVPVGQHGGGVGGGVARQTCGLVVVHGVAPVNEIGDVYSTEKHRRALHVGGGLA